MILNMALDFVFRVPGEGELGDRFEAGGIAGLNRIGLQVELVARNRFSIGIQYFKTSDKERKRIEWILFGLDPVLRREEKAVSRFDAVAFAILS